MTIKRSKIRRLLQSPETSQRVCIKGWVRTRRDSKTFSFLEINDGSCLANMQVIADHAEPGCDGVAELTTGSAVAVTGALRHSPGKGQKWEILAEQITVYQIAPETYPLQKKRHSDEFLRSIAHLRPRTNKYGAAFRIRSELAYAVHRFFRDQGFIYVHTPIITGSDCEGAGELFRVTSLPPGDFRKLDDVSADRQDFFGKKASLTVSGQLEAELFALALGDVYTFGPTFRAENSNTRRHAAEFWMVEPEMAFCELSGNMDNAEALVKHLVSHALENCAEDLDLFFRFVDKSLPGILETIVSRPFARISYAEAVDLLKQSKNRFEHEIAFGYDLQTDHERFLAEQYFGGPVMVYDYPRGIKPFYMRVNDDGQTVAAMDVIVPGIGEIIGGSQREDRLDMLEARMAETGLDTSEYWWYLDSRRYGSVPHSGYGLGFERMVMLVTGISNIRDVLPFARTPGNIDF
ncbi:MAG: asparagine--tRNA ligase [Desulfobacteraceae bacterium]|nr:asparagine--tRNA ligase [Desulfobacteraceae bacterium]